MNTMTNAMTWDAIAANEGSEIEAMTSTEADKVSGGFWRSYAKACVTGGAGAVMATRIPTPQVAAAGCAGGVLLQAVSDAASIAFR